MKSMSIEKQMYHHQWLLQNKNNDSSSRSIKNNIPEKFPSVFCLCVIAIRPKIKTFGLKAFFRMHRNHTYVLLLQNPF